MDMLDLMDKPPRPLGTPPWQGGELNGHDGHGGPNGQPPLFEAPLLNTPPSLCATPLDKG